MWNYLKIITANILESTHGSHKILPMLKLESNFFLFFFGTWKITEPFTVFTKYFAILQKNLRTFFITFSLLNNSVSVVNSKPVRGHSIITLSQNDQNLNHPPPCSHLFDFGHPHSRERSQIYINSKSCDFIVS